MVGCWREPSSGLQVADHGCILTHAKSRVEEASSLVILWLHCKAYGVLVPRSGFEPMPPAVEAQSPNHRTAREVPGLGLEKIHTQLVIFNLQIHKRYT